MLILSSYYKYVDVPHVDIGYKYILKLYLWVVHLSDVDFMFILKNHSITCTEMPFIQKVIILGLDIKSISLSPAWFCISFIFDHKSCKSWCSWLISEWIWRSPEALNGLFCLFFKGEEGEISFLSKWAWSDILPQRFSSETNSMLSFCRTFHCYHPAFI